MRFVFFTSITPVPQKVFMNNPKKNNNIYNCILPFDFFGLIFYLYNLHGKSTCNREKVKTGFKAWHIALSFSQVLIKSESMRRSK